MFDIVITMSLHIIRTSAEIDGKCSFSQIRGLPRRTLTPQLTKIHESLSII